MHAIDNELIRQKDRLIVLVNDGQFQEALTILEFVRELWEAAGYGYKYHEMVTRIRAAVWDRVVNANHANTSRKWQRVYENLPA